MMMLFITEPSGGIVAASMLPLIPGRFNFSPPDDKGAGGEPTDPKKEFRNLAAELKDTIQNQGTETAEAKAKIEKINERMDELEFDLEKHKKSTVASERKGYEHVDAFKNAFYKFVKGDRHSINADSVGVKSMERYHKAATQGEQKSDNLVRFDIASSGALLMPDEVSMDILDNVIETSPIMRLVATSMTSNPRKVRTLRTSTPGINWLEEEGTNQKGKVKWKNVILTPKKAAARYGFSIENEQDSAHDIVSELNKAYREDFEVGVASAAIKGDGNGKPKGMLGNISNFNSGALALTTDMLIQMQESLKEEYQNNADWLFTRSTRAYIRSLVLSSTNGLQYTWEPDFTRRSPTLLLGNPVNIARNDDLKSGVFSGNFTQGDIPVIYGDFSRGYEVCMRTDMYIIDDPYTESDQFVRNLNIMSRVDGQPLQTEALTTLTITS